MNELHMMKCAACEGGTPPLAHDAILPLCAEVPAWHVAADEKSLTRMWEFADFAAAFRFVTAVAAIAEAEGHHPDIAVSWNKVTLTLSTHAIGGLSKNDFIVAAKIDQLA